MQHASSESHRAGKARRQWQLGQTHAEAGRWEAAQRAHQTAAQLAPDDALYALNHARALLSRGLLPEASAEALRAYRLDLANVVLCEFAAECLIRECRYYDAVATIRALPADAPRNYIHHALFGLALMRAGQQKEAITEFFQCLADKPDWAEMHHNLGLCFGDLDMQFEAAQCFNTALILGVGKLEAGSRGLACYYQRGACQWEDSAANVAALFAAVRALPADSNLATTPFAHIGLGADREDQLRAARSCIRYLGSAVKPLLKANSDWQPGARRLRIGYVSADLHQHATSILMAEMFERHDAERFDVRLYSHGPNDGSAMRARLQKACTEFLDVRTLTDLQVAQRIRADGIDLLIDLKGHTRDHRLNIFAHRPAPLQVTFLGFPGTSGADYIDYLIGDAIVSPLAHAEHYSEKLAHMPICYQPNDRLRALLAPPSRASQGLPDDKLVLCGFNQPFKISPEVFDSWCRLLHALPNAVLWLLEWNQQAVPNLKKEAQKRGIDPARLIGAKRLDPHDHVARFQLADLFLDTWPCNAHTTASDALWSGVPIVTMLGETFASRVAAGLLSAVGTPELVCRDLTHYEATVIALAADAPRLAALQTRIRAARNDSPLFDTTRFTRDIETLYLRMATRMAQGLAPEHLLADSTANSQ